MGQYTGLAQGAGFLKIEPGFVDGTYPMMLQQQSSGNNITASASHGTVKLPPAKGTRRTSNDIIQQRLEDMAGLSFPEGMPLGPFDEKKQLIEMLQIWAKDPNTYGGSFVITANSKRQATSSAGEKQLLLCDKSGKPRVSQKNPADVQCNKVSKKTDCPWGVWIEHIDFGWVVSMPQEKAVKAARANGDDVCLMNNHPLLVTALERNMNPALHQIPGEVAEYANCLKKGAMGPSQIYHALVWECQEKGITVTFNQDDIRNKYAVSAANRILDCTNLIGHLKEREAA